VPDWGRMEWEADGRLAITTAPTSWAYGARLSLPLEELGAAEDPAYVCVRGCAERSTVGIGVLNRAGDRFLDRRDLDSSQGDVELRLRVPNLQEAGDLIVQTWDVDVPGTVRIASIELVVFAGSSGSAP
jgi:hypothetical protein